MTQATEQQPVSLRQGHRAGWRQAVLFGAALLGGSLAGAGGVSYAAIVSGSVNWHQGHRLQMIQRRVHAALDAVGATSIQEDKIHDIIANGFAPLGGERDVHRAMRQQMIDLLRAPTVDRAAVEKLRADEVARFDARSKAITGMILDAADQLSPEQRTALADKAEAMMAHGHEGWHKWGGPRNGGSDDGMEQRHGHGPDDQDDSGPNGKSPGNNPG